MSVIDHVPLFFGSSQIVLENIIIIRFSSEQKTRQKKQNKSLKHYQNHVRLTTADHIICNGKSSISLELCKKPAKPPDHLYPAL